MGTLFQMMRVFTIKILPFAGFFFPLFMLRRRTYHSSFQIHVVVVRHFHPQPVVVGVVQKLPIRRPRLVMRHQKSSWSMIRIGTIPRKMTFDRKIHNSYIYCNLRQVLLLSHPNLYERKRTSRKVEAKS